MPFFSKVFKNKDGSTPAAKDKRQQQHIDGLAHAPTKPKRVINWNSKEVDPEDVEELLHRCTLEMKSRAEALDAPFLLLPFRPELDTVPARTFIGNFFQSRSERSSRYAGAALQQELRLTEPIVLCSIVKWCWSRIPGGVVTWTVYEMFRLGEQDSNMARTAFDTFIPLSVESATRKNIVYDFFDLLAAIAAHGKTNGFGGRKLSRMAGWWAFEHSDDGKGFEGGYKSWTSAADASSHLFFAYLRSLSPESVEGITGISTLPRSLQALVAQTEYPPETPLLMQSTTPKVVMIVDSVSPTPFALLRRAKHFQYRDEDELLQQFSHFRDPVEALTDECKRVLYCIATTNSSIARSRHGGMTTTLNNLNNGPDESWSRFQDLGFSDSTIGVGSPGSSSTTSQRQALRSAPRSRPTDLGRPTTPSWADFLSSGFADENVEGPSNPALLLPPDKILPPIGGDGFNRAKSPGLGEDEDGLEPGELASITQFELDDTFWWVWMTSLAAEEPTERKAVFGRCALIETDIYGGRWLLMEEQVKGASPGPEEGAYIAEKKSLFTLKRKNKDRRKSTMQAKSPEPMEPVSRGVSATPSKSSMSLDQQAKIKAAAAALAQKQKQQDPDQIAQRRGRIEDAASTKTNSIFTLGLTSEASPAMKWANAYDKEEIRRQYLGDNFAGKGLGMDSEPSSVSAEARYTDPAVSAAPMQSASQDKPERELPTVSKDEKIEALPEATPSPPPAPLPKEPIVTVTPVDDGASVAASEAASVPLPEMTPHEEKAMEALEKAMEAHAALSPKVTQVERKPVPRSNDISNHPAFRNRVEQQNAGKAGGSPATEAARRAWEARDAASAHPEAKKTGQAGIRKFFAKKRDNSDRQSLTKPAPQGLQPPSEASVGRHLSLLRKKTPTQVPTQNRAAPVSAAALAAAPAAAPAPVTSLAEQEAPSSNGQHNDSEVGTMSRVDSEEHHDAAHAFSRFDQGPLDGVPAFVPGGPRESYDDGAPSISTQNDHEPDYFHQQTSNEPQRSEYATPVGDLNSSSARHGGTWLNYRPEGTAEPSSDAASEVSMDYPSEPVAPTVNDRWAQIRKNAAERAARMSEEQSGRSQTTRTEDDGETSGEETIEARVARIKARVAELTGNQR